MQRSFLYDKEKTSSVVLSPRVRLITVHKHLLIPIDMFLANSHEQLPYRKLFINGPANDLQHSLFTEELFLFLTAVFKKKKRVARIDKGTITNSVWLMSHESSINIGVSRRYIMFYMKLNIFCSSSCLIRFNYQKGVKLFILSNKSLAFLPLMTKYLVAIAKPIATQLLRMCLRNNNTRNILR